MFTKLSFFKSSALGGKLLLALFLVKVTAGFFYSYYFSLPSQIENADTWTYFIDSKAETDWLLSNPKAFFADLFTNYYTQSGSFFSCTNSFWNDLKTTFFVKLLAVLNLFSGKNYFINLLFFNAFFMFGGIAFYRLFKDNFNINKWVLIATVFFTPSFLFWCSSIHKDGIVFSATAISLYSFNKLIHSKISIKYSLILITSLTTIFALRNYYLLAIIPAFIAWIIVEKFRINAKLSFGLTILCCLLVLIFSNSLPVTKGVCKSIVEKHNEFLTLDGNTKFQTPTLGPNTKSIIAYFPFAMQSSLLRPFPNNLKSKGEIFAMLENYFFLVVLIIAAVAVFYRKGKILDSPIILSCLLISFLLLLFIGYTVCFEAAIVRYRSVSFPLLILPCVLIILGEAKEQKNIINMPIY